MNIFKTVKEKMFKSQKVDSFAAGKGTKGTQKYELSQFPYLYTEAPDWISLYTELYDNVTVLENAVDTYVELINPGWSIESDKEKDVKLVEDVLKSIQFSQGFNMLLRNTFIYGFSGSEIVLANDMQSIERLVNVPNTELRIKRNKQANITDYYQLSSSGHGGIQLNPNRFIYTTRQVTTDHPYGRSLFKALPFLTRIMLEMQDAIGKIYRKYGAPRFHVRYIPPTQLDDTTLRRRLNTIKEHFDNPEVGEDFFTAGDVEVTMIGAEGQALKFNIEMSEIMQGVMAGLKMPAGVLGYNYGSTETHLTKQIEILLGRIFSYQDDYETMLNFQFMPLIAKIYNLSEIPKIKLDRPIIADELVEEQTRSLKIDNVDKLLGMNLIDTEYAINRLKLPRIPGKAVSSAQRNEKAAKLAAMATKNNEKKGKKKNAK